MTQLQKLRAEAVRALFFTRDVILIEEITLLLKELKSKNTITVAKATAKLLSIIRYLSRIKGYQTKYLYDEAQYPLVFSKPPYEILTCGTRATIKHTNYRAGKDKDKEANWLMQFRDIKINQQFSFEGKLYVKTSNVEAQTVITAKEKFIPLYQWVSKLKDD